MKIVGNGISAIDGSYGFEMELDELYEQIQHELRQPDAELEYAIKKRSEHIREAGPPPQIDPANLSSTNWGVIWPPRPWNAKEQAHFDALHPLIERRRQQVRQNSTRRTLREFEYRPGWSYVRFLEDAGPKVKPGQMNTEKIPYYLLIVGDPERIPWSFQTNLDGEYAVGRLWFNDPGDCQAYVTALLAYEDNPASSGRAKRALLLGTQHAHDPATETSAAHLVRPLHAWLMNHEDAAGLNFQYELLLGNTPGREATRANFLERMAGPRPPAVWFTAGHGLEWKSPNSQQEAAQGGLVFQDWSGGGAGKGAFLAGLHAGQELNPAGSVAFCFACFSAGTPMWQDWVQTGAAQIAQRPFVARLPQKLLANGALGFIGHVSRAWTYSILGAELDSQQITPFQSLMLALLRGARLGHATDYMNYQWGELTKQLLAHLEGEEALSKEQVVNLWLARNDFRAYVLLGDPAARLAVESLA